MLTSVTYRVGHWTFEPSAHELRSNAARVRLEHRASATLSLLCERADAVVRREQIIERVWGRQHLSPNSVAVVIGDLRRALDVPAGEPGSIETVPKAGYRLIGRAEAAHGQASRKLSYFALAAAMLALSLAYSAWRERSVPPELAVATVENAMGTHHYDALIQACRETVVLELGRHTRELQVIEAPVARTIRPDYVLQQRWVLWSGKPELVLMVVNQEGRTVWSGSVFGNENQFPAKIEERVRSFASFASANP